jgi:hypothetical protein
VLNWCFNLDVRDALEKTGKLVICIYIQKRPDRLWDPANLLLCGSFPEVKRLGREVDH